MPSGKSTVFIWVSMKPVASVGERVSCTSPRAAARRNHTL